MSSIPARPPRNLLLRAMRSGDLALLAPDLRRVDLRVDDVLVVPGEPIRTICFPDSGIVTLANVQEDGSRLGLGHFGYEGMAGWAVLLGSDLSVHEERVTAVGGPALAIPADRLLAACRASESLNALLLRFVQAFVVQLGRTISSSLTQPVDARLCRWALMGHDRIEGDEIEVTHKEIAVMLGIRRASVTDALHILEGDRLIRCQRGRVIVTDREGLRRIAGGTYGAAEAEYSRLIAPFPEKGSAS